jgi:hypothetical protein
VGPPHGRTDGITRSSLKGVGTSEGKNLEEQPDRLSIVVGRDMDDLHATRVGTSFNIG